MCIYTWADSEGEFLSCALKAIWITFMGYFFWISFGQSLWIVWITIILAISQDPSICVHASQPRWILPKMHLSSLALVSITPLWPPKSFSVHVLLGRSPDFRKEECVVWAGPSLLPWLSSYSYLGVLVSREWISNCFTLWGAHLPPASVLPMNLRFLLHHERFHRQSDR